MKKVHAENGSLYLEALVGLTLLSFSLLAVSPMFFMSVRNNASSEDMTMAAMLAHDKAEELKALPYDALIGGTTTETVKFRSISYVRTWTIQEDTPQTEITTVTVTVTPSREAPPGPSAQAKVSVYRVRCEAST